jgi:death on curing protein
MTPRFLTLEEIIEIQADQIERYGGSPGTRDKDLLQSAIAMPESG